jgi:uncharacterized cupredoxin-like copper-binding protein
VTKPLALAAAFLAALGGHSTPARLGVGASEFHLVLSRAAVKAGPVQIELQNEGEDPHDLRLRRIDGTHTYSIRLTSPGARRSITVRLRPGRYRLWCSVANHRALGMQAVLRVRR